MYKLRDNMKARKVSTVRRSGSRARKHTHSTVNHVFDGLWVLW